MDLARELTEGDGVRTPRQEIRELKMLYAVLVYETAHETEARNHPERAGAYWGAYKAYSDALVQAGVMAGGNALQPISTATTVRIRDGKRDVQDGPFADTKEQLGGMFVIDVPHLEAALEWAARCPAALTGSAEVRPILPMNG